MCGDKSMESIGLILGVTFGLVLFLLASGMWVSIALGATGVFLFLVFLGAGKLSGIGWLQFNIVNNFTFIALPLFIFMGELILQSGISDRFYKAATSWVGFLPGGLLHSNIVACALFSAISGVSMATAAAIGTVALPAMEKFGYDRRLTLGSLAAGGTLGILIPPSCAMIIYGSFVQVSVGKLFMGGVFPGLTMAALFMIYILVVSLLRPEKAPAREKFSVKAIASSAMDIVPLLMLIFMVMGTIYLGLATPTEAAALGALFSMVLCAIYRKLTWKSVMRAGLAAIQINCWLMLIVIGANSVSIALAYLAVPSRLAETMLSFEMNRLTVLALVALMYIILGCFMDGTSMMLLTLPVVYPIMMALGFDGVWFGIIMVILIEIGQITPPVGVNLFVIHGITGKKYLGDIIRGIIPFVFIMILMIVLLTAFPDLVLWLPDRMIKPLG